MIDTLTSLRLLFALMVFASHLVEIDNTTFAGHIFKEGYVGVSFFFILSGFIIAYNYCERIENKQCQRRDFWVARVARIYPLHLLTLLVAALTGASFVANSALSWAQLLMSATLTNSYIPRYDFFFAMNSPAWSLCCEQLFYIIFPLAIVIVKSPKKLTAIAIATIIIVSVGAYITPENYAKGIWYTNPITRLPDFFVGVLLWHIYRHTKERKSTPLQASTMEILSIAMFALFYICAEDIPKILRYSFYYWLPISCVLLVFARQEGALSRILSAKLLVKGGEISFGFYLIHSFVVNGIGRHMNMFTPVTGAITALAVTLALSYVSYNYFEKPMNRWVKKMLARR